MGYDFVRYLGESLGGPVNAGLVWLFLAYQVVVSALVFLFDSGFPPWLVIAGWVLLVVFLAVQILRRQRAEKREEREYWQQEQLNWQRISRLKERLKTAPGLQTLCRDCGYSGTSVDPCCAHAVPSEKKFRFRSDDARSYCLLWSPGEMPVENEDIV
ncbi:MAG: hypothetical protein NTW95_10005 [Candidatus Aminicenantes bacterium]|nr:hypothetical protein [Candidatus Aminicenantes bacterium]